MPNTDQTTAIRSLQEELWEQLLKHEHQPGVGPVFQFLLLSERELRAEIMVSFGTLQGELKCKSCHGKGYVLMHRPKDGKDEKGKIKYQPHACTCTVGKLKVLDLDAELKLAHQKRDKDEKDKLNSGGTDKIGTETPSLKKRSPRKSPAPNQNPGDNGRGEEIKDSGKEIQGTGGQGGEDLPSKPKKTRSPKKPSVKETNG